METRPTFFKDACRQFKGPFRLCAALILGVFLLTEPVSADSIEVLGIPLPVDRVIDVDANSVELSFDGVTRVVSRAGAPDVVVGLFFRPQGRGARLSASIIEKLLQASVEHDRYDYVSLALPFYVNAPDLDHLAAIQVLESFGLSSDVVEAVRKALVTIREHPGAFAKVQARPSLMAALLYIAASGPDRWIRTHVVGFALTFSEDLKRYLSERLRALAVRGSVEEISAALDTAIVVLTECLDHEDRLVISLRLLRERVALVQGADPQQPLDFIYPLVEASKQEDLSGRILYPIVAAKFHESAEAHLKDGQPLRTLVLLSRLNLSRRTERTHQLVVEALKALPANDIGAFRDVEVESMLVFLALNDPKIRAQLVRFVSRASLAALDAGDVPVSEALLSLLTRIRPDPHPENDDIRIEQALMYLEAGRRSSAHDKLNAVRTGIPLLARLRLNLAGLYVNRYIAVLFVVIPIATAVWFFLIELRRLREFRTRPVFAAQGGGGQEQPSASQGKQSSKQQIFTQTGLKKPTDPRLEEYGRCLATLGVPPSASLKEIKTAYRNLVKYIHPDTQKDDEGGIGKGRASNRFIELTQAYDRALELRRVTGLGEND